MDSEDKIYIEIPNRNINKFKMALLFAQTNELKKKYEDRMDLSPESYRLVNREWLDNYKNRYNYNDAIQSFKSFNNYSNYHDFKFKISKFININKNNIPYEAQDIMNYHCQIQKEKYNSKLEYPVDIELVKEQFFQDLNLGNIGFPICNVYLGDKTIFVIDDQRSNLAYFCSLIEAQTKDYNFQIQVNSILFFQNQNILNEQIDNIISEGFNNYFSKRNININSSDQQKILEPNNQKHIGFFINIIIHYKDLDIQNNQMNQRIFNKNNNSSQENIIIFNQRNNNRDINSKKNNIYKNYKINQENYNQIKNNNYLDQTLGNKITFLENELKKMNDMIKDLINKNNKLENMMNDLKNENLEYKKIINQQNQKIENLNDKFNFFDKKNNNFENEILDLVKELREKEREIKSLKSSFPFEIKQGEKLMSIIFVSVDQKVHHSFICKNTDIFINLEKLLYDIYPKISECENYFLVNGTKINKYQSLESNNIKDSDIITLNQYS